MNADPNSALYTWVIIGTIVGLALLAAVLLVPVSRFITREMRRGERWNDEIAARRDAGPEPPTPDAT